MINSLAKLLFCVHVPMCALCISTKTYMSLLCSMVSLSSFSISRTPSLLCISKGSPNSKSPVFFPFLLRASCAGQHPCPWGCKVSGSRAEEGKNRTSTFGGPSSLHGDSDKLASPSLMQYYSERPD